MAKDTECPTCGKMFKGVGHHWRYHPDHKPAISDEQHEVLTGMMLGDGYISEFGDNPIFEIMCIQKRYIQWFSEFMGCLAYTAKPKQPKGGQTTYRATLRAHEEIDRYAELYDGEAGRWPSEIHLTPTILTHWYVGDGCYDNKNSQRRIRISMANTDKKWDRVNQYFESAGLPTPDNRNISNNGQSAVWNTLDSVTLFRYMNNAPIGYEYKFPEGHK